MWVASLIFLLVRRKRRMTFSETSGTVLGEEGATLDLWPLGTCYLRTPL